MKYEIIRRLRDLQLYCTSTILDYDIQILNLYANNSTRMALAIDSQFGDRELFVEISWLEDVENDRYIFEVVEEYQNINHYGEDKEYKTYHIDRLIDNLVYTFSNEFDIYPSK